MHIFNKILIDIFLINRIAIDNEKIDHAYHLVISTTVNAIWINTSKLYSILLHNLYSQYEKI